MPTRRVPMVLVPAGPFETGADAGGPLDKCRHLSDDCRYIWFEADGSKSFVRRK